MRRLSSAIWLSVCLVLLILPEAAGAQASLPFTGFELALSGSSTLRAGRTASFRGVSYRVRGLSTLVPFEGRVEARLVWPDGDRRVTEWAAARSEAEGRFALDLPVPEAAFDGAARMEVRVADADRERIFEVAVRVESALEVVLRTDRQLYEAGEPVHVWALVRDRASGIPLADRSVHLQVGGGALPPTEYPIRTNEAGVVYRRLDVPENASEGDGQVILRIEGQLEATSAFRVGTRTWERLFAELEIEEDPVRPGAPVSIGVHVTAPSGAPVGGANVALTIEGAISTGVTGPDGRAIIATHAPSFFEHRTGRVAVVAEVDHPAHGSVRAVDTLPLAVPLALDVEVIPRLGALMFEVDDVIYVRLADGLGRPPGEPTELTVTGPAVRGGRYTTTTDSRGIAEVPVRLGLGAASATSEAMQTGIVVDVRGPLERRARAEVAVMGEAELAPVLDDVVRAPGEPLGVRLIRRPGVARAPAVVELLHGRELVASVVTTDARLTLTLPPDRIGLLTVRARPLRGLDERALAAAESLEGTGASAAVLVRPPLPDFARVQAERRRYTVGETARLTLETGAGGPRRWAALLVRDLAAHGGEQPFELHFLAREFERAIIDPSGPDAPRFLRASLAAYASADHAPSVAPPLTDALGLPTEDSFESTSGEPSTLLDPVPSARELERRGVGAAMHALEDHLEAALAQGALDEITTGTGARRRFREDIFADDTSKRTLGDGELTPRLLEAADPSASYDRVARRVARARLVRLLVALAAYLDPGDEASVAARMAAREPSERWLPRMVERGVIDATDLDDPWGGRFRLRPSRSPVLVVSAHAVALELASPGPDGRLGTADDVRDPFARVVPAGTPYAVASGEDALMRRLAALSPLARTLVAIRAAYERTNAEMAEEEIGDAVLGEVSEGTIGLGGLGVTGYGAGGGGSGSGYGRGSGRGALVRQGSVRVAPRVSNLARVVRERFPPTLLFRPRLVVDPSGSTEITVPLADNVSTFLVEIVVWREDGWVSSASTEIEVDRDIVVDAPVPGVAHLGDRLRLPLRVSNRGSTPREIFVGLRGDGALGIPDASLESVTLAGGEARVVEVEVRPNAVGEGSLTALVTDASGEALDAVRRPMRVVAPARRVNLERLALAAGEAELTLEVPEDASPRAGHVRLLFGPALFDEDGRSWRGEAWGRVAQLALQGIHPAGNHAIEEAFRFGVEWRPPDMGSDAGDPHIMRLTRALASAQAGHEEGSPARARLMAGVLLGLSPIARLPNRRSASGLAELIERVREEVASGAVLSSDDPGTWTLAAAALAESHGERDAVAELARRLERHVVDLGEDRWLLSEDDTVSQTMLYALAELALDHRENAFRLLASVARHAAAGHWLSPGQRELGRLAMARLVGDTIPSMATVVIDGEPHRIAITYGAAQLPADVLAQPGRHQIRVRVDDAIPLLVRANSRFGLPWSSRPAVRGPFELAIEGEAHGLDETAELELVVRNRTPRTLPAPIVEVELPTGAELTEDRRLSMGVLVERSGDLLRLRLPLMRPGQRRRIRLPLRWSVAGRLEGLGVAAYALDRPEAVTVLPPRTLEIR